MKAMDVVRENLSRIDAAKTDGESLGGVFESLAREGVSGGAIRAAYYRLPARDMKSRQKPLLKGNVSVEAAKSAFRDQIEARQSSLFAVCVADAEFATLVRESAASVGIRHVREMLRHAGVEVPEKRIKDWLSLQQGRDESASPAPVFPDPVAPAASQPPTTDSGQDGPVVAPAAPVVSENITGRQRHGQRRLNEEE